MLLILILISICGDQEQDQDQEQEEMEGMEGIAPTGCGSCPLGVSIRHDARS